MQKDKVKNESVINKFFKENKSLAYMLPLLFILIIVLIFVYSGRDKDRNSNASKENPVSTQSMDPIPSDKPKVEVLPQTERTSDGDEVKASKDPFESPMMLTGILQSSDGEATAIIESGGVTYVVKADAFIGDSSWKVLSIYEASVMLDSNGKSMMLEFSPDFSSPEP